MKGLSIITNFGCKSDCHYCIWKSSTNHNLYKYYNINGQLNALTNFLLEHPELDKFSLSGGGDPLNVTLDSLAFYDRLNAICFKYDKKYDIHTSYSVKDIQKFLQLTSSRPFLRKIVYHASSCRIPFPNMLKQFKELERFFSLRFVYVITDSLSLEYLIKAEDIIQNYFNGAQLSYREYVGTQFTPTEEIKEFCKNVTNRMENSRFIEQNDYNYYIMPDGSIAEKFLEGEF